MCCVVHLSAAPVRGRHSGSSVMIRIGFTPDALPDATLVASYDTGIRIGFRHDSGLPYTLS